MSHNLQHLMLTLLRRTAGGFAALVREAFGSGEPGVFYQPDDPKTQYTTELGTTQVTAVGNTVGLAIDQSRGAKLGAELVDINSLPIPAISDNAGSVGVWTAGTRTMTNSGATVSTYPRFTFELGLNPGSHYFIEGRLSGDINAGMSSSIPLRLSNAGTANNIAYDPLTGIFSGYAWAAFTYLQIVTNLTSSQSVTIESISVRELPGYQAYQASASKRPLFARVPARGRVNMLTNSAFIGAVSGNPGTHPTAWIIGTNVGTPTMTVESEGLRMVGIANDRRPIYQTITLEANTTYTYTVLCDIVAISAIHQLFDVQLAPAGTTVQKFQDDVSLTAFQNVSVGNNTILKLVVTTDATAGTARFFFGIGCSASNSSTPNVLFKQIQLEKGPTQTPYQRVGLGAFDVTEEGEPTLSGWLFDGIDDNLETNSMADMTAASRLAVVAGVRTVSNAAARFIFEYGPNTGTTAGTFALMAPSSGGVDSVLLTGRGSSTQIYASANPITAPNNLLISGNLRNDTNLHVVRIDGVQLAASVSVNMDINFTSQKLYIGARGGASNWFSGYMFGLMFRGTATPTPLSLLEKIEKFIGKKTGQAVDRNVVNLAAKITPTTELWAYKVSDVQANFMLPFNGTQAYYWDIIPVGDDCMIIRNCFRRLYTKPDALTINTSTIESQIKAGSNLEMAVMARKAGTADPYRFIPQHEGVNTCVLVNREWKRNGVVFSANDAKYIPSRLFEIESHYNCVHPDQAEPLATLRMKHTATPQKFKVDVELVFLQSCDLNPGYSIMNNSTLSPKVATVFRQDEQRWNTQALGSNVAAPGQDTVTGCAMRGSSDTSVLVADWSSNPNSVMQSNQYNSTSLRQWFASTGKFYNEPFDSSTVEAGQSFRWSGEWRMAEWSSIF